MVLVYNANYELVLVPATTAEILPERDERAMGGSGLEEHPGVTTAPQPVQHVQCSTSAIATSQYWTDRGAEPALEIVGLACYPWFGRVASKDNLSDGPSRRGPHGGIDDGDLRRLGAVERPLILPSLAQLSRVSDSFDAMHFA